MPSGNSPCLSGVPRRVAACALFATAALACALFASPAVAAERGSTGGVLSPRLAELAKPSLRSAPQAKQARELSLAAQGPGSLLRDGARVLVDVRFEHGAAARADDLRAAGAQVVNVSSRYQTVTVAAKPAGLTALAEATGVLGVKELLTPVGAAVECPSGAVVSEGDEQLRAAQARQGFGIDGSGATVGILSDSFDADESAATSEDDDVKSADLPGTENTCGHTTPVDIVEEIVETEEGADEGRGMAQIVHDLAPAANLAFASAFNGEIQFADNIGKLVEAGADIVVDDVFYFEEPFFQDGPVAVAANEANEEGVAYFSAAGNDNLIDSEGRDIASWEAHAFRDAESCPAGVPPYAHHCIDFNPGVGVDTGFGITVEPKETLIVDLQWAQPWQGVTTDLDAYLVMNGVDVAVAEDPNVLPGFQKPVEVLGWTNPSSSPRNVTLSINRCDSACGGGNSASPRVKFGLLGNGGGVSATEYPESRGGDEVGPTIFGHSGAAGAVGVGAIPAPIFFEGEPEPYSSRGPVSHYFGPVEELSPAPALVPPEELSKPDLAATDCGATTFFNLLFESSWRFCGTSAAAPHAAAVAALMLDEVPGATPDDVRAALVESATPLAGFGPCAVGAGLIDAVGAIELLSAGEPGTTPGVCLPPASPPWIEEEPEPPGGGGGNPPVVSAAAPEPPPAGGKNPSTFFRRHPRRLIRTTGRKATAVFRFGSDQSGVTFFCRVDGGFLRICPERFVRLYAEGPHVVRVMARNSEGKVDSTPAVFHFKVKRTA